MSSRLLFLKNLTNEQTPRIIEVRVAVREYTAET